MSRERGGGEREVRGRERGEGSESKRGKVDGRGGEGGGVGIAVSTGLNMKGTNFPSFINKLPPPSYHIVCL